jgi:iron complex outermembrane receptor protein
MAFPAIASAQSTDAGMTANEADGGDGSDIVVTARKRSEDIQKVPVAITAYTAKDLADRNISNFNDLANITPGIAITSIAGGNVQNIYIRGLAPANTANDLNVEANVGVFIDGIYQTSRNTLDIISVLDVGQIEIAKGPQSALFGRSTFAGAVAISSGRPTDKWTGTISGTAGEDSDYRVKAAISGPLADGLTLRVAGGYLTYDGYGKNAAAPTNNLGGYQKYAVSAALEYAPTDNFKARLSGFYTHSSSEITPEYVLPITSFNCGTTNAAYGLGQLYCGTLVGQKTSSITPNAPNTVTKNRQISLDLDWRVQGVRIVSVTGFTAADNRAFNDYDGTSAGTVFGVCTLGNATNASCGGNFLGAPYTRLVNANLLSSSAERVRTFSQEIRLQSDNSSPFSWLLGGSFFNSRIPLAAGGIGVDGSALAANERFLAVTQTGVIPTTGTGTYEFTANPFTVANSLTSQVFGSYTKASTKTFGIFGAVGYKFGRLRLNAEGRYNIDRKVAQVFSINNFASAPGVYQPIFGTSDPAAGVFPVAGPVFAKTFNSFAPRFTADFQATPNVFIYASAAKGVRSGGFNTANPVSATGILASEVAYNEETNWTYEGGFKTNLFDRKLLVNASIFHVDWNNAQVSAFTNNPTAVSPVRIVQNAGNIKTTGFEGQIEFKPIKMFGVGGSVTYSDPKFQAGSYDGSQITQCRVGTTPATYTSAPGCPAIIAVTTANGGTQYVPTLEGKLPQRAVKWQWNVHATGDVPLSGNWALNGRVDVSYTGPAYNNLINTVQFGKRTLTSARLGIGNGVYSIAVFANNIFDKNYVVNSINQPRAGYPFAYSIPEVYLGEGRRVGVTATAKF